MHVAFSKLMAELNKKEAPYALSLANRLYGEQTYEFVKVTPRVLIQRGGRREGEPKGMCERRSLMDAGTQLVHVKNECPFQR